MDEEFLTGNFSKEKEEKEIKIEVMDKQLSGVQKAYYVYLEVNEKEVEISIQEDYNENTDSFQVSWDILEDADLSDEEYDAIDDWVSQYKYNSSEN